jgi:hypothetical protein
MLSRADPASPLCAGPPWSWCRIQAARVLICPTVVWEICGCDVCWADGSWDALQVKMVTGDQRMIAIETSRRLGLGTNIMDGADLMNAKDSLLAHKVVPCFQHIRHHHT